MKFEKGMCVCKSSLCYFKMHTLVLKAMHFFGGSGFLGWECLSRH